MHNDYNLNLNLIFQIKNFSNLHNFAYYRNTPKYYKLD